MTTTDFVNQTDWSRYTIADLLAEIEGHADTMRGAWENGANSATPTPGGYIWIPGEVGTPEPWPTAGGPTLNQRQNQCIWTLEAAHTTLSYEEIVNGCGEMVLEAPAP